MNQKRNHIYIIALLTGVASISATLLYSIGEDGILGRLMQPDTSSHIFIHSTPQVSFYSGGSSLPQASFTSTSEFIAAPTTIAPAKTYSHQGSMQTNYGTAASANYALHTSSARTVHSYGGGNAQETSNTGVSSRGRQSTNTANGSYTAYAYIPNNAALIASNSVVDTRHNSTNPGREFSPSGPRKVYSSGATTDGNGNYWDDDEEAWLPIPGGGGPTIGDTKVENGISYTWNGTEWIVTSSEINIVPLGETPLWLLCLLMGMYIAKRKKTNIA